MFQGCYGHIWLFQESGWLWNGPGWTKRSQVVVVITKQLVHSMGLETHVGIQVWVSWVWIRVQQLRHPPQTCICFVGFLYWIYFNLIISKYSYSTSFDVTSRGLPHLPLAMLKRVAMQQAGVSSTWCVNENCNATSRGLPHLPCWKGLRYNKQGSPPTCHINENCNVTSRGLPPFVMLKRIWCNIMSRGLPLLVMSKRAAMWQGGDNPSLPHLHA